MASCSLEDLTHGSFQTILDDPVAQRNPEAVTRLVLCSGKVYMDLCRFEPFQKAQASGRVACARMEQLYPFPGRELRELFARYKSLQDVVWLQEEPRNMGAWLFVSRRLSDPELGGWQGPILYAGRPNAASPAEGSKYHHDEAQNLILQEVLSGIPAIPQKVRVASSQGR
jgi:2-oxoglutarate dehydrogenase E1 component